MSKQVKIALGVVLVVVAIGGISAFAYLQSLMSFAPLAIQYQTIQTQMPEQAVCAGSEDSPGIAKEIFNLQTDDILVAGGTNPMPDAIWDNFRFNLPYLKNSTRNLLFQGSCFFRSPDRAQDCQGQECFTIIDAFDYTWLKLTTVQGQSCFPDASGCSGDRVEPGYVSITTITKCHQIRYDGPEIYELSDGQGNRYVMHATATGTPEVVNVELPAGWTLTVRTIDEPLELLPFGGGSDCYYNIVRDNLIQSYHQFAYATDRYPATE